MSEKQPAAFLGRTGVEVSRLCLGTMMFGGGWGNPDHKECIRIIHRALDAGINFIDTADIYSRGESEEIVGKAVAQSKRRDEIVLATKFSKVMGDGPNKSGGSRYWIMKAVEDSLRRLKTDHIDLYQMHRPDNHADIEESLGALTDLVAQGKVRLIGSSTFLPSQIVEAQWASRERRLARFMTEQPPYSLLARGVEAEMLPTMLRYGMGVLVWGPLSGGWLSGRFRKSGDLPDSHRRGLQPNRYDFSNPETVAKLDAADKLAALAEEAGMTLPQLAIAFVLEHPAVTCAIIGPRTGEQLESLLVASSIQLDDDILDRVDEIVPPGTTLSWGDAGVQNPWLEQGFRRRRREPF